MGAPVRFRIKNTGVYINPVVDSSSSFLTTGSGRRSIAMRAPGIGPNAAIDYSAESLRNQAREADRKNGLAKVIADRLTANIIGTGIVPQPKMASTKTLWERWTDEASTDGMLDFYGLQAQVTRTLPISGECFVRLRTRRRQDGLTVPLQLQVLESDFVPMNKNEVLPDGNYIRQGIEFDPVGRRVAYWMYRQHPADRQVIADYDTEPKRIPASEVLHIFDAISARPGQVRGVPGVTQVLAKLKDLDAYDDAELQRKKVSAMVVGFIRRNVPEGMSEAELVEAWGADAEIESGIGSISLEPGSLNYLEPGEEPEWSTPQDVGGMYESYKRDQYRLISAMSGLLYEQLTGDFSNLNDRTWRAAFNEFKRRCEMWQHHIIVFQFCRPVWSRWTDLARLTGALRPGEVQSTVKWIPQAWPYINPVQDVEAAEAEIRAGLASRSQKVSERGNSAREVDAEQAADNAEADKLGVVYDSDGRQRKGAKVQAEPQQSDQVDGNQQAA